MSARVDAEPLDLDLTWGDTEVPRDTRDHTPYDNELTGFGRRFWWVMAILAVGAAFAGGLLLGTMSGNAIAEEALAETKAATVTAEDAKQFASAWQERAEEASETAKGLALRAEEASAAIAALELRLEEASQTVKAVAKERDLLKQQKAAKAKAPTVVAASVPVGAWSREKVAATLRAAAANHGLSAAQTAWVVDAGCRVAYAESTYRPDARNGQYLGLFQFGSSWASEAERLDPVWSCNRFVRVYVEGGEAKVRQHWKATI